MKQSNFITFLSFVFLILFLLFLTAFRGALAEKEEANVLPAPEPEVSETIPAPEETPEAKGIETLLADTIPEETTPSETAPPPETTPLPEGVLFIGDSRTVGLFEYAGLIETDFFCDIGMSVYNIYEKTISVPGVGKVRLEELLQNQTYGKIYLMLGINELGYHFEQTVEEYQKLVTYIRDRQPEALLFLQANLHVTQNRSEQDPVINNPAINKLNAAISKLADGQKIYYFDANPLFDDANGNLSSDQSADDAHLYARYYPEWGTWITEQTAKCIGGDFYE